MTASAPDRAALERALRLAKNLRLLYPFGWREGDDAAIAAKYVTVVAEARAAAIECGLEAIEFAHGWIGGLPVTPSFEDKFAAQAALELARDKLRALAPPAQSETPE